MSQAIWVDILLGLAVTIALLCVLGLTVMRDAYQRLHFPGPIVGLSMPLIVLAVWLQTDQFQARFKSLFMMVLLFFSNAVLSHATARAQRIRKTGHWELQWKEKPK